MFNLNAHSTVIFSFIEITYIFLKLHNSLSVKIYCASVPSHLSHVRLCDPMDVAIGIFYERILERVAPLSKGSS